MQCQPRVILQTSQLILLESSTSNGRLTVLLASEHQFTESHGRGRQALPLARPAFAALSKPDPGKIYKLLILLIKSVLAQLLQVLGRDIGTETETLNMNMIDKAFGIHAAALTFRSERGSILATNIANSGTPGFQARDYDFRTALKKFSSGEHVGIQATNSRHIRTASSQNEFGNLLYRVPTRAATNNNTVEADVEQAAFSDNALRYQTSLQFLNGTISGLRKAITGRV